MSMSKLFVIAGHGAGDPGACGGGYSEAERVRTLAKKIKQYGGDSVILGDFSRNYYADNGISHLPYKRGEIQIVELHMDSGASSARGGHVIIQSGIGGSDKYDRALANAVSSIFPGRAIKIVERNDLANPARAAAKGYPYRLVENGFISNSTDRNIFNANIDRLAKAYCEAFGIGPAKKPEQHPGKAVNDLGLKYRAHVQTAGWLPAVHDGQVAGTTGYGKRMEALKMTPPDGVELAVDAHIQGIGWRTYSGIKKGASSGTGSSPNDPIIGTVGQGRRLEAIRIRVVKKPDSLRGKTVHAQAHVQGIGWVGAVGEGQVCGTTGQSRRLEAVRIWFA